MEKKNKLGYTWYPKDWGNSEKVFELTLIERGLYRELIDMAMLNDNKTKINSKVWARKFGSSEEEIEWILSTLNDLKLIDIKNDLLFIPSCEPRLNLVRGGSKGGKTSKKNKPTNKPLLSLDEKNDKPTLNQIEIESKIKEKETKGKEFTPEQFLKWFNETRTKYLEIPSNCNMLTYDDKINLNQLTQHFNGKQFGIALLNLCNDQWANENNMVIPKHFLNLDNFNKYVNIAPREPITREQKKRQNWGIS